MSQKTSPASASSGIDLDRLCGILIDHKWIIIASTLVTTFIGASYAVLAPPVYRADALVQIESSRTANPLDEVTSLLGKQPPSQSEIEIIRSRGVLGRAVDILGLTLIVEPVRLPLIGDFLVRRGMLRPDFFCRQSLRLGAGIDQRIDPDG
ncbi:MAG: Wzz/FepE/Etk N-terminal domain-containing protein [Cellvibrionaceae bacterium]|nr:Wzz/FepE/Etk N-terminal domain-containing protein [Cellvibrionaceae bacterium]